MKARHRPPALGPAVGARLRCSAPHGCCASRRDRRRPWPAHVLTGLAFAKAAMMLASPLWLGNHAPRLLWNRSASVPAGLYLRLDRSPRLGDLVAACLPVEVARLARERDYLPPGRFCPGGAAPVLKRLAATKGSHVELKDAGIALDGRAWPSGAIRQLDRQGRPMPQLAAYPLDIPAGAVFLLGEDPASFDSRYFGPLPAHLVLGVYRHIAFPGLWFLSPNGAPDLSPGREPWAEREFTHHLPR